MLTGQPFDLNKTSVEAGLTDFEKQIWAAAFGAEFVKKSRKRDQYLRAVAAHSAANAAVESYRKVRFTIYRSPGVQEAGEVKIATAFAVNEINSFDRECVAEADRLAAEAKGLEGR